MKVSVIIPTFKPQEYLAELITCLNSQDLNLELFEIIIVLNGIKEGYYEKVNSYLEKTLLQSTLVFTEKKGVSNARNAGLDLSKGDYIVFLDDDDLISDNYLSALLEKMKGTSIVVSNLKCFKDNEFFNDYYGRAFARLQYTEYNLLKYRKFLSSPWGKMFDKNVIGTIRFNDSLTISEDAMFCFELSKNIRSMRLAQDNCIYYRRIRENSASRVQQTASKKIKDYFKKIKILNSIYLKDIKEYSFIFYVTRILAFTKLLIKNL